MLDRSKVIKDFCFPNGILVRKLDYRLLNGEIFADEQVTEIIQDILYGAKNWRETTFVFTLDSNEEAGESGDNYINCMCVLFEELVRSSKNEELFLV